MEGSPVVGWQFSIQIAALRSHLSNQRSSAFICGFIASAACGPVATAAIWLHAATEAPESQTGGAFFRESSQDFTKPGQDRNKTVTY